jgi:type III restriction enzyme
MDEDNELRNTTNHLLFQMATGSGKTIMMAGLMLYLYEKGYRNFLFFVNSTTIIDKTKDNFLNAASSKYLFAQHLKLQGKTVNIVSADNFEGDTGDDICIVFETIQGLHSKLTSPREDALTLGDFEDKKVVLIADEAHHLSAETKKGTSLFSENFK